MHGLTIVFDLDGTLVDTAPDLVAATNHALADLGLKSVADSHLKPFVSHGARRMIIEGLALSGQTLDEAEIDRLLALFLTYYEANIADRSRPFEGAEAAIADLTSAGARLAICTNKREVLSRHLLRALGLAENFAAIAGRDTFQYFKPHPEHLLGAIRVAGGDVTRAVMVGDTGVDIATAKAAGVPSVLVTFGYPDAPLDTLRPDISINHYRDLGRAIGRVTGNIPSANRGLNSTNKLKNS